MVTEIKTNASWIRRHPIWTGIIAFLLVFIIIGALIPEDETTKSSNGSTNSAVISGTLDSFFPTREEIPTEFTITPISNLDISNIENAEGVKSAKSMSINKLEGSMGVIAVDMVIDEFSSQEQAKNYYESLVNGQKQAGGYSEMSVSSKATCFGYTEDYGLSAQFANVLCYNKNVFFEVSGTSSNTFKKSNNDVKTMLSVIDEKIK